MQSTSNTNTNTMPDNTTSKTIRAAPSKLRRVGLIYRVTAGVFALSAIFYAVNSFRHEAADFDISMSVLQFALAIVFFSVGTMYYRKANATQPPSTEGSQDK